MADTPDLSALTRESSILRAEIARLTDATKRSSDADYAMKQNVGELKNSVLKLSDGINTLEGSFKKITGESLGKFNELLISQNKLLFNLSRQTQITGQSFLSLQSGIKNLSTSTSLSIVESTKFYKTMNDGTKGLKLTNTAISELGHALTKEFGPALQDCSEAMESLLSVQEKDISVLDRLRAGMGTDEIVAYVSAMEGLGKMTSKQANDLIRLNSAMGKNGEELTEQEKKLQDAAIAQQRLNKTWEDVKLDWVTKLNEVLPSINNFLSTMVDKLKSVPAWAIKLGVGTTLAVGAGTAVLGGLATAKMVGSLLPKGAEKGAGFLNFFKKGADLAPTSKGKTDSVLSTLTSGNFLGTKPIPVYVVGMNTSLYNQFGKGTSALNATNAYDLTKTNQAASLEAAKNKASGFSFSNWNTMSSGTSKDAWYKNSVGNAWGGTKGFFGQKIDGSSLKNMLGGGTGTGFFGQGGLFGAGKIGTGLGIGVAGYIAGAAGNAAGNYFDKKGDKKLAAGSKAAGGVAEYAAYGAAIGSLIPVVGTAIGALVGGAVGLYQNFDNLTTSLSSMPLGFATYKNATSAATDEVTRLSEALGEGADTVPSWTSKLSAWFSTVPGEAEKTLRRDVQGQMLGKHIEAKYGGKKNWDSLNENEKDSAAAEAKIQGVYNKTYGVAKDDKEGTYKAAAIEKLVIGAFAGQKLGKAEIETITKSIMSGKKDANYDKYIEFAQKGNNRKEAFQQTSASLGITGDVANSVEKSMTGEIKGTNILLERYRSMNELVKQRIDLTNTIVAGNQSILDLSMRDGASTSSMLSTINQNIGAYDKSIQALQLQLGLKEKMNSVGDGQADTEKRNKIIADYARQSGRDEKEILAIIGTKEFILADEVKLRGEIASTIIKKREEETKSFNVEKLQKSLLESKVSLLESEMELTKSMYLGLGPTLDKQQEIIEQLEKQISLIDASIARQEKEKALKNWDEQKEKDLNEMKKARVGIVQKELEITKNLREGYLDALSSFTNVSGAFSKIILKKEMGMGEMMRFMGSQGGQRTGKLGAGSNEAGAKWTKDADGSAHLEMVSAKKQTENFNSFVEGHEMLRDRTKPSVAAAANSLGEAGQDAVYNLNSGVVTGKKTKQTESIVNKGNIETNNTSSSSVVGSTPNIDSMASSVSLGINNSDLSKFILSGNRAVVSSNKDVVVDGKSTESKAVQENKKIQEDKKQAEKINNGNLNANIANAIPINNDEDIDKKAREARNDAREKTMVERQAKHTMFFKDTAGENATNEVTIGMRGTKEKSRSQRINEKREENDRVNRDNLDKGKKEREARISGIRESIGKYDQFIKSGAGGSKEGMEYATRYKSSLEKNLARLVLVNTEMDKTLKETKNLIKDVAKNRKNEDKVKEDLNKKGKSDSYRPSASSGKSGLSFSVGGANGAGLGDFGGWMHRIPREPGLHKKNDNNNEVEKPVPFNQFNIEKDPDNFSKSTLPSLKPTITTSGANDFPFRSNSPATINPTVNPPLVENPKIPVLDEDKNYNKNGAEVGGPSDFALGGLIPGIGDQDTVPAMLTPGEYVVPKKEVAKFMALKKSLDRNKFYYGGPVGNGNNTPEGEDFKFGKDILSKEQIKKDKKIKEKIDSEIKEERKKQEIIEKNDKKNKVGQELINPEIYSKKGMYGYGNLVPNSGQYIDSSGNLQYGPKTIKEENADIGKNARINTQSGSIPNEDYDGRERKLLNKKWKGITSYTDSVYTHHGNDKDNGLFFATSDKNDNKYENGNRRWTEYDKNGDIKLSQRDAPDGSYPWKANYKRRYSDASIYEGKDQHTTFDKNGKEVRVNYNKEATERYNIVENAKNLIKDGVSVDGLPINRGRTGFDKDGKYNPENDDRVGGKNEWTKEIFKIARNTSKTADNLTKIVDSKINSPAQGTLVNNSPEGSSWSPKAFGGMSSGNSFKEMNSMISSMFGFSGFSGLSIGFAEGGVVPGSGNQDTVPAMLTPGERVLTKKEAAHWESMNMALNRNKFALGGYVGGMSSSASSMGSSSKGGMPNISISVKGDTVNKIMKSVTTQLSTVVNHMMTPSGTTSRMFDRSRS